MKSLLIIGLMLSATVIVSTFEAKASVVKEVKMDHGMTISGSNLELHSFAYDFQDVILTEAVCFNYEKALNVPFVNKTFISIPGNVEIMNKGPSC